MPQHPVQHLGQQVKGLIDRDEDGDFGLAVGLGRHNRISRCKKPRIQPAVCHQRVDPHDPLDPAMGGHVAVPDPGQCRGQGAGGIAQKGRDQPEPPQYPLARAETGQGGGPGPVAQRQMQHGRVGRIGQIEPEAAPVGNHVGAAGPKLQRHTVSRRPPLDDQSVIVQGNAGDLADRGAGAIAQGGAGSVQRQMPGRIAQKQPFDPCWHPDRPFCPLQLGICSTRSQHG